MNQPSNKKLLAMYRAFKSAGFSLTGVQSAEGRDGICWNTTVTYKGKKILSASNGGFGGPDELVSLQKTESGAENARQLEADKDALLRIPELADAIRASDIDLVQSTWHYGVEHTHKERVDSGETNLSVDQVREQLRNEATKKVDAIRTSPPSRDNESVAGIIGMLSDTKSLVDKMRRACKGKIVFFVKDDPAGFMWVKLPDTPENRIRCEAKHGEKMDGYVADEIAGL